LGESKAGQAILERRPLFISNLKEDEKGMAGMEFSPDEDFLMYGCIPLVAKGEIKGVLEVFSRKSVSLDDEWMEFFQVLASQAAIAIDNSLMFEDLQRSHLELSLAYDATIEGWSRALDLRDKDTEGHTQRVTELSVRLATRLGLSDAEIVHMRRGGLLHDIGKMGVMDSILHKPGPLTEEESKIMRLHPGYAYDMLMPISYLRPALDIPYSHHEKWDGSGYPLGLKGDAIPLVARIFAVSDVFDALTSDRPYRKAWSVEKTLDYLRSQSGRHFDPRIVEAFIRIIQEGK
jgi:HD-GYP domain-containing protein (c-di-GMP phosphodiesterase class II)